MPLIATETPKESPAAPSFGSSFASCRPVVVSNKYAAPESWPLSSSLMVPAMAVVPLIATELPKE